MSITVPKPFDSDPKWLTNVNQGQKTTSNGTIDGIFYTMKLKDNTGHEKTITVFFRSGQIANSVEEKTNHIVALKTMRQIYKQRDPSSSEPFTAGTQIKLIKGRTGANEQKATLLTHSNNTDYFYSREQTGIKQNQLDTASQAQNPLERPNAFIYDLNTKKHYAGPHNQGQEEHTLAERCEHIAKKRFPQNSSPSSAPPSPLHHPPSSQRQASLTDSTSSSSSSGSTSETDSEDDGPLADALGQPLASTPAGAGTPAAGSPGTEEPNNGTAPTPAPAQRWWSRIGAPLGNAVSALGQVLHLTVPANHSVVEDDDDDHTIVTPSNPSSIPVDTVDAQDTTAIQQPASTLDTTGPNTLAPTQSSVVGEVADTQEDTVDQTAPPTPQTQPWTGRRILELMGAPLTIPIAYFRGSTQNNSKDGTTPQPTPSTTVSSEHDTSNASSSTASTESIASGILRRHDTVTAQKGQKRRIVVGRQTKPPAPSTSTPPTGPTSALPPDELIAEIVE